MLRYFFSTSTASKMRAVLCPRAPIAPSELVYTTDHPEPKPKEGHVLIRVKAYGLKSSELFTRQGHSPGIQFPRVLGIECVGVVKDAGGGSKWKEGDVVAACMGGMGRQYDGTCTTIYSTRQNQVLLRLKWPSSGTVTECGDSRCASCQSPDQILGESPCLP